MKARLLKAAKLRELRESVEANLANYRKGNFAGVTEDPGSTIETEQEIDSAVMSRVDSSKDDHREVENCSALFQALPGLSYYLARDERLWTCLVHSQLLDYARKRWPIPKGDKEAVDHIRTHYFVTGARGFERDNAASRLWWMAALCSRCGDISLEDSLRYFLHMYDVRANIIERPTTSQNPVVFFGIIKLLRDSYAKDKSLFERLTFRAFMKKLNLRGGSKLLDSLGSSEVEKILMECI
jgi:hypothetical protein